MPYIKKEERQRYKEGIAGLLFDLQQTTRPKEWTVGDLNFIISSIVWKLFQDNPSYTLGNNLVGVLECVKLEFYRRNVAPYEDSKIKENGDI